jgi:hypothetical protein
VAFNAECVFALKSILLYHIRLAKLHEKRLSLKEDGDYNPCSKGLPFLKFFNFPEGNPIYRFRH